MKGKSTWFYVDTDILREYNIPPKDWYRCVKKLVESRVIQIKKRAGKYGRNYYTFPDDF